MAEEQENELTLEEEGGGGKKKLIIIIAAAVVLLLVVAGALFFFMSGDDSEQMAEGEQMTEQVEMPEAEVGTAMYVTMPRPFTFNVPGTTRDRLVQIKVQLMVRGDNNHETAKRHIPLIEGTLLKAFSTANADRKSVV